MFQTVILVLALLAVASAFAPARFGARSTTKLFGECEERLADAKGRCPGEAGYTPIFRDVPADFADFKRQAAEKKAKQEAKINKSNVQNLNILIPGHICL